MNFLLLLQIIALVSGVVSILVFLRAFPRTADLSEEDIARYSIRPHMHRFWKWLSSISHDIFTSVYQQILRLVAYFSKHTHRITTHGIAKVERKKVAKKEALEGGDEVS